MYVLALDTTSSLGSSAILRDDDLVRLVHHDAERAHANHLPAALMSVLSQSGLVLGDIDVFAVAVGPGSFTGLRVGIATMQGLAFATGRPLLGGSTLEALARVGGGGRVAAWVDAWGGEVYAQVYNGPLAVSPPRVAHPAALLREIQEPTTFMGTGAVTHAELITRTLGTFGVMCPQPAPPLAGVIGHQARVRVLHGERPGPDAIRPLYVSRDALAGNLASVRGPS